VYEQKLEEQKRRREEIIRLKSMRRQMRVVEKMVQEAGWYI
jgi:hypothetical protein